MHDFPSFLPRLSSGSYLNLSPFRDEVEKVVYAYSLALGSADVRITITCVPFPDYSLGRL